MNTPYFRIRGDAGSPAAVDTPRPVLIEGNPMTSMTPKRLSPAFFAAARPPPVTPPTEDSPTAGDLCWGCGKTVGGNCDGLCPIPRSRMKGMVEEIARQAGEIARLKSMVEFQQTALDARSARSARRSEAKTVAVPAVREIPARTTVDR